MSAVRLRREVRKLIPHLTQEQLRNILSLESKERAFRLSILPCIVIAPVFPNGDGFRLLSYDPFFGYYKVSFVQEEGPFSKIFPISPTIFVSVSKDKLYYYDLTTRTVSAIPDLSSIDNVSIVPIDHYKSNAFLYITVNDIPIK